MASDDSVEDFLRRVLQALDSATVPYMLTGSFASSFHGAPRTTHDVDLVIAPTLGTLERLLTQFPHDGYYVSRDAALQAYGAETLFNVVDFASGWKVDFIFRKSRSFSAAEFERRRQVDLLGTTLWVASPEDVVVSKLEWAKLSESDRQIRDVIDILRTQDDALDTDYIERWVRSLDLDAEWTKARKGAG
jgi:hypothetical protein